MSDQTEYLVKLISKARRGSVPAASIAGVSLSTGIHGIINYPLAVSFLEYAAEKGALRSIVQLSRLCEKGVGVPLNKSKAHMLASKAAARHDPQGLLICARHHRHGIGTPKNLQFAHKLYQLTREHGRGILDVDEIAECDAFLETSGNAGKDRQEPTL